MRFVHVDRTVNIKVNERCTSSLLQSFSGISRLGGMADGSWSSKYWRHTAISISLGDGGPRTAQPNAMRNMIAVYDQKVTGRFPQRDVPDVGLPHLRLGSGGSKASVSDIRSVMSDCAMAWTVGGYALFAAIRCDGRGSRVKYGIEVTKKGNLGEVNGCSQKLK